MIFGGIQKLTLLDFPGKVACTVFTVGCNFRCPFCHNGSLVEGEPFEQIDGEEVLSLLQKRQGILEGVCITGGEPLLQDELPDFLRKVKALGYPVKLDTNGSRPEKLKALVDEGLIDYVAMDIKNCPARYAETAGVASPDVDASIDFLLTGKVDYEFRTTVVDEFHTVEDIEAAAKRIQGAKRYFLQSFVESEFVLQDGLHAPSREKLEAMQQAASPYVAEVSLRGVS